MKQGVLNIKVDYKPLDTYKNVTVRSGSNRQNYNANTRYFEPDRRIDPYVVLVECGVNDVHNIVSGLVNANLTDVSWKQSTPAGYKDILTTDTEFKIGTGADKGKLSIFKNVSDLEPVTILFTARFMDNTTKRVVNFQESFNLITLPIAESPVLLETSAPVGYNLFPTENNQGLICQADLYRGKDKVPAAYWWYKGNTLLTDTNGYSGTAKNKLFIPANEISKTGDVFKCEAADCSAYFNELVQEKVEADPKVIEWRELYRDGPRNLLLDTAMLQQGNGKWDAVRGVSVDVTGNSAYEKYAWGLRQTVWLPEGVCTILVWVKEGIRAQSRARINVVDASDSSNIILNAVFDRILTNDWALFKTTIKVSKAMNCVFYFLNNDSSTGNQFIFFKDFALYDSVDFSKWIPDSSSIQRLISQKTEHYKTQTSLPENYRPNPKPTKLYTADFMLMKKFPEYYEGILYPTSVSPESTAVQVEMVLNTNDGIIQQPERFFSVGWLKQANGTYKYKGFKVKISIADIKALNDANKQLDYELREDLTLKP